MKNIFKISAVAVALTFSVSSCIEEIDPQTSTVTVDQAANAPGAYDNFVSAITGTLSGTFIYGGSSNYPWDFGYPSLMLQRDMSGNDILIPNLGGNDWYSGWYTISGYLTSESGVGSLMPWYFYYKWIYACNTVLTMAGEEPAADKVVGAGIAHAMRALYYMDLAQMFGSATYTKDKNGITVPIVTESTPGEQITQNPRATNEEIYNFIIEDLKTAETQLANYKRPNKTTPDLSVVYGLEARAYLLMGEWANAKAAAEKAMAGYSVLSKEELVDMNDGFNNPDNNSWMFCYTHKATDPNIKDNDGDSSWGSQLIIEVGPSACGYSANYTGPKRIDKHLYDAIPYSDIRKMHWIDFSVDDITDPAELKAALEEYTSDASNLNQSDWTQKAQGRNSFGGASVKFRPAGGEHADQYKAWCVSIPFMRVEEMKLIQAEAAGRLNEAEGIQLLTAFAKTRDAEYEYGKHDVDMNYPGNMSTFVREIWFQRRVELWAEGFAGPDLKRLGAGIVRNYKGTNHPEGYRYNTETTPAWLFMYIPSTYEETYNNAIVQNDHFDRPAAESPEHAW